MARIEELEKENKKLAREAVDAEKRWQKAEEELADLREADGDSAAGKTGHGGSDQIAKLVRMPPECGFFVLLSAWATGRAFAFYVEGILEGIQYTADGGTTNRNPSWRRSSGRTRSCRRARARATGRRRR